MTTSPKPSLKQIAEAAGVSIMTVSRILRSYPNHDPVTRAKVLRIAEELGYKKNPLVSALMANIRHKKPANFRAAIAVIQLDLPGQISDPNQLSLRKGIFDAANASGFEVELFDVAEAGMTPERLMHIIQARGFRCLIFEPFMKANYGFDFDFESFAAMSITNSLVRPQFDRVEPDHYAGFLMAVEKLREKGYERIGFIPEDLDESIIQNRRLSAFLFTQSRLPKRLRVPLLWRHPTPSVMKRKLNLWIRKNKPEVILTSVQSIPEILSQLGFRIPEDLGFVNLSLSQDSGQQAGINSNWYEIGFHAACEVVDLTIGNKFGPTKQPKVTFSNPYWVDGLTLPDKQTPHMEIA